MGLTGRAGTVDMADIMDLDGITETVGIMDPDGGEVPASRDLG